MATYLIESIACAVIFAGLGQAIGVLYHKLVKH